MIKKDGIEVTGGEYYVKDGVVWKAPTTTYFNDGSASMSTGFPVCTPHECLGEDGAKAIAEALNLAEAEQAEQESEQSQ